MNPGPADQTVRRQALDQQDRGWAQKALKCLGREGVGNWYEPFAR